MSLLFEGMNRARLAFVGLCLLVVSASGGGAEPDDCRPDRIDFQTESGVHSYRIEVVDTYETRAQGLMHRTDLAADQGMLFVYQRAGQVAFWMKDTPLPLDIIFINSRGIVCSIAAHTTPFSLENIPSRCAAQTVLEVNAGQAAVDGIRVGAPARHEAISKPVWGCPK
ncbi:MAG: DUF192 domain-containing protein [Pikeienuella sp.]